MIDVKIASASTRPVRAVMPTRPTVEMLTAREMSPVIGAGMKLAAAMPV